MQSIFRPRTGVPVTFTLVILLSQLYAITHYHVYLDGTNDSLAHYKIQSEFVTILQWKC